MAPQLPLDWKMMALIRYRLAAAQFRAWVIDSFEIEQRKTTISIEVFSGFIHFISCLYVLPVIPNQLSAAGYDKSSSIVATAVASAFGCLLSSYITNLPFAVAPPTAVSIYLAVALQQKGMTHVQGDAAVILSGCVLLFIGVLRPLLALLTHLIPDCIQASTAVGIGLITALAGAIELGLVEQGQYTIVQMGPITPAIVIATISTIIIALATRYNYKGAFISGLIFGTFTWWWAEGAWPAALGSMPAFELDRNVDVDNNVTTLLFNLIFLYILTLNGIARSMSDLAGLTSADGSIPRGSWLFIMCGLATILSGYFSGPPILISPESAGGIKAGARTGLSALVCGLLFALSMFFCPIFSAVPPAGTSPLLIMVGMTLFMNTARINWNSAPEAVPAFFVLLLIPFTYSILAGVGFGYVLYIAIGLFSGNLLDKARAVGAALLLKGVGYQNILASFRHGQGGGAGIGRGDDDGDGVDGLDQGDGVDTSEEVPAPLGRQPSFLQRRVSYLSVHGGGDGDIELGPARTPEEALPQDTGVGAGDMETITFSPLMTRRTAALDISAHIAEAEAPPASSSSSAGPSAPSSAAAPVLLTARGRTGSIIDRLSMDLATGIHSMQA